MPLSGRSLRFAIALLRETANAAFARSIGASASYQRDWRAPKWWTRSSRRSWTRSFSARPVTYANERGSVKTITIVGVDEADLSRGQVSWESPVARALMKAHEGDVVEVRAPSGLEQIEVLEIRYGDARGETQ